MRPKLAFVDRDGTINVDKGYVHRAEDFEYIPGALEALRMLTAAGVRICIVTNQAGIARGLYTEEDFKALTKNMIRRMTRENIAIADVLYCPHHPQGTVAAYRRECECRKPRAGLLRSALKQQTMMPEDAVLIGDKNSDIDAGRSLGMTTYLVQTGYGSEESRSTAAEHVVPNILAAVNHLLSIGAE